MSKRIDFNVLIILVVYFLTVFHRNVIAATTSTKTTIAISGTILNAGKIPPIPADDLPNQSATIINSYSSATSISASITPSSTASGTSTSTKSSNANRIRNGVAVISVIVGVLGCFIGMKLL